MPRDPECTFAILQIGEQQIKAGTTWLKRVFGATPLLNSPKDFQGRLESAAAVVIQSILHDACENAGIQTKDAQFEEIPKGFHIIVMFGQCLIMSIYTLLEEEDHILDVKNLGARMIDALLTMHSVNEQAEQYKLCNILFY